MYNNSAHALKILYLTPGSAKLAADLLNQYRLANQSWQGLYFLPMGAVNPFRIPYPEPLLCARGNSVYALIEPDITKFVLKQSGLENVVEIKCWPWEHLRTVLEKKSFTEPKVLFTRYCRKGKLITLVPFLPLKYA